MQVSECVLCSSGVLVPEAHLARGEVELHGAEQRVGLLVLVHAHGCVQIDGFLAQPHLLFLHQPDATES